MSENRNGLEIFRDNLSRAISERFTGKAFPGDSVFIFVGPASAKTVREKLTTLPDDSLVLYISPEKSFSSKKFKNVFFLSFEDDFYSTTGIFASLTASFGLRLCVCDGFENIYGKNIKKIDSAIQDALYNFRQSREAGVTYLRHSIRNLSLINENSQSHIELFAKVPAVICAAGPSLEKQLETLKEKQDELFIFAVARVAPFLLENGITPDLVIHNDPRPDAKWAEAASKAGCILCASISSSSLAAAEFEKILWYFGDSGQFNSYLKSNGIDLYDTALSKTVTVSAIDMARKLGFTEAALLGSDLCVSKNGRLHTDKEEDSSNLRLIKVRSVSDGVPAFTTKELFEIKEALERYISEKADISLSNCSSAGAFIKNVRRLSFDSFVAEYCKEKKAYRFSKKQGLKKLDTMPVIREIKKYLVIAEKSLKEAGTLMKEARSATGNIARITELQNSFNESVSVLNHISGNKKISPYFLSVAETLAEYTLSQIPELKNMDIKSPFTQLLLYIKHNNLIKDLMNDFLADFTEKNKPFAFTAFKNFSVSLISKNNPELADKLMKTRISEDFRIIPHLISQILSVSFPDGGKIFDYDASTCIFLPLQTAEFFITENNFDTGNDCVVFPCPCNWTHVAELALKRPDSKFMIVEHSAAYINELISKSLVTRFFPSETLVATARGNPSWEKICFSKLESWKKAGKRILFFETPESFRVPGAMELKSKLRNIMNSA